MGQRAKPKNSDHRNEEHWTADSSIEYIKV